MFGCNGKFRFTILFPSNNQQMLRFGDCNPSSEDRARISMMNGYPELVLYPKEGYEKDPEFRMPLPPDTLVSHGWYETEHTGFVHPKDFTHE